ncbi:zinc finger protein 2 [Striga asiatica]|uniref:Zinc finger protein 2 n=1 Tax=Striga asiatica TaxID=4170 RepID=A0A5A7R504_STRAF|nr:zinc finger protein 2 [Striga asiatica]
MDHPPNPTRPISEMEPKAREPDQDNEIVCKYCDRKFSSTEALSWHEDAHKVQRAVKKTERELGHISRFGPFGDSFRPNPVAHPGPYGRSHDFRSPNVRFSDGAGSLGSSRPGMDNLVNNPEPEDYSGRD